MLRKECERSFVGGHIICTGFAIGIVLRTCPLAGGSVILLCLFMYDVGVKVG